MQVTPPSEFLTNEQLDLVELELEKEESVRSLLQWLNSENGGGMEFVLHNPRFQVAWRRACKLFNFYADEKRAKCSASNIEAFQDMAQKNYPEIYSELTESGLKTVSKIKEDAKAQSRKLLEKGETSGLHIGPIELLKKIGVNWFGTSTPETQELFQLLHRKMNAKSYGDSFNAYVLSHFVDEKYIISLLNHREYVHQNNGHGHTWGMGEFLSVPTLLELLTKIKDLKSVYRYNGAWINSFDISGVSTERMAKEDPEGVLKLLHDRNDENLQCFPVPSLIGNPNTSEDLVFSVGIRLLKIQTKKEKEENDKRGYYYDNGHPSRSDNIRTVLANRFPERYLAHLEASVGRAEDGQDQIDIGNGEVHSVLAKLSPERYIAIIEKQDAWQIIRALDSRVENRDERSTFEAMVEANLGPKILDLLLRSDIELWRISKLLEKLAISNPKEFADKILEMWNWGKRPEGNVFDAPLSYRNILQRLVIGWAGAEVLQILAQLDWSDISIHTHALLVSHVPEEYHEMAKTKGFDFEKVAREMVNGSEEVLEKLVSYLTHYAFSESAYHARGSYNEFLAWQAEMQNDPEGLAQPV